MKKAKFKKIEVRVDGSSTKFKIGDSIQFGENDTPKVVTAIKVDSDGCIVYLLTYVKDGAFVTQWMTENDMNIFESMGTKHYKIGF